MRHSSAVFVLLLAACSDPSSQTSSLALPGDTFYPSAIAASTDGTLYVGSLATGEVVTYAPGAKTPTVLVPQDNPPVFVPGLTVDDASSRLYVCTVKFGGPNFSQPAGQLRVYDLAGHLHASWDLPDQGQSICEDVTVCSDGTVYVADAFLGRIYSIPQPQGSVPIIAEWLNDSRLRPSNTNVPPFGAHGIACVDDQQLYVDNFNTGALLRISVASNIAAGEVAPITVTPPLANPEALRPLDATHLAVADDVWGSTGSLSLLELSGNNASKTVLHDGIAGPTGVAIADGNYWVTEGQTTHFVAMTAPKLPFRVIYQAE